MFKSNRQNHRCEPKVSQIDKAGWKSFASAALKMVVTCVLAFGIPYSVYMYYQHLVESGYFIPKQITVYGNVSVDDKTILDASGLLSEDANLFEVDIHAVVVSIETLAWVKKASVTVTLPDTVRIDVVEHQPFGIVSDGTLYIVDENGAEIKRWSSEDELMTPVVSIQKPIDTQAGVIVNAFKIADMVARSGFDRKIQEVHYDDATGYSLFTDDCEIRFGYDRFEERISNLLVIDDILQEHHVLADYILLDGDSLDRVVVKPKPILKKKSESAGGNSEGTDDSDADPDDLQHPAMETT